MKKFLRIVYANLLVCLTIGTFAQTAQEQFTIQGANTWICPGGVTSVTLYIWSAGGAGALGYSGAGGNLVHTVAIPVTGGQTYTVFVGYQVTSVNPSANPGSFFALGDSTIVYANGPHYDGDTWGANVPGALSIGNYIYSQYRGGYGIHQFADDGNFYQCGGGGGASDCSNGYDGNNDGTGGISYHCSGGFWAGDGGGFYQDGPGHASGGGGTYGGGIVTKPGQGLVLMYYTCSAGTTGTIGNAHTVTYPPEMVPDKIMSIVDPTLPVGTTIGWQQSTNNINFVTAKNSTNTTDYRFDLDSILTITYYRRGNNACIAGGGFGNWSDTVQIKVMNSNNGRNGGITGYIQTRNGSPIFNRKIFVQSLTPLKGRAVGFLDSAYTDQQGKFSVDSIFYGDKNYGDSATVRFKVYPDTAKGHKYSPASAQVSLSTLHPTYDLSSQPFRDTTVFAVTGQVIQICKGCLDNNGNTADITGALDSVKIVGIGKNNGISNNEKDSTTTGYINPQYGRYVLNFQETDQYTITPSFNKHKFIPKDTLITVNSDVSNVNFNDTTTHVISGFYGAGCGDVIGTAVLEFDDVLTNGFDGKPRPSIFKKQVTTDKKGHYSIRLPARKYIVKIVSANVKDPLDPLTTQSLIKKFFKALPSASLTRDITNKDTVLDIIYNRTPQIAVSGLYADSSRVQTCSAFKNYEFWPQSIRRPVTFKVYQGPVSRGCLLDTGTVYVTTDISNTLGNYQHDTVKLTMGVGIDSIMAAQPNTVINQKTGTYSKKFSALYTDIIGRGVSTDTIKPALPIVVVTGAAIDPSGTNYVTVSPQLPFVVLHDPPGSASSAAWTQSVTSEQAISFKAQNELSVGGFLEVKLGLEEIIGMFVLTEIEAWVKIDDKFSTTNTTTNTSETVITNTSEQTLETSKDPALWGEEADLVYGAALNINYKIGTEIEWDSTHCQVLGPKPVMVTDIKNDTTSFLYTIGHIKNELIPTLQQAVNAQTNEDSIAYFENQIHVWEQLVENNKENIEKAPVIQNLSFSNGTSSTYSNTLENSTTNTYDFDLEIANEVALEAGFEIAGNGVSGGVNVGFKMATGSGAKTTHKTSTTTSYTLEDNNLGGQHYEGDYFSVNVKKDPVYGTPMFETVAGGTQCPHEEGTIALDNCVITADVQTLAGVKKDTANFTIYLNNLSHDATINGKRPYILFLNAASNPAGATVLIGGTSSPDGVTYVIPNNGGVQPVTISVIRNSSSGVYNYDNLEFIATDPCFPPVVQGFFSNPHEFSSIELSADFQSPVSGVTLVSPVNNWVANQASNNIVPVTFTGYDTTKLASIAFEYSVPGTGNWLLGFTLQKKNLGITSTTKDWNISKLADGPYNLRLKVKDKNNNVVYSKVAKGKIDRQPPQLFGTPQPANAIYTAGTQISYSYTENINTNLKSSIVKMRDMTADSKVLVNLSAYNNTMIIVPQTSITGNINHLYRVIADSVADVNGNVKTTADTMYFTVNPSIFGTGADGLNIASTKTSMYEDDKGSMDVRFARNSPATTPIVIYYNLFGNANYLTDYSITYNAGQTAVTGITGAQGEILLPKDSSSVTMYIKPVNDSILAPDKKITFTLSPGGGYSIGSNYSVTDTILNHNTAKPVITTNKPATLCAGDSITLSTANKINGVNVKSYKWSTGEKTQSITVKTSGSYTVKVTDNNGLIGYSDPTVVTFICGNPATLTVNVLSKSRAALKWNKDSCAKKYVVRYRQSGNTAWKTDTVTTNKDTLKNLNASTTYEWQVASICKYPDIIMSSYTAGSNFTTLISLTEFFAKNTSDYKQTIAGDGFSARVYPNPASSNTNLEIRGAKGRYTVIVEDLQGTVLWKTTGVESGNLKIPLSNLAQGVYMVIVNDKIHKGTLKLVKE